MGQRRRIPTITLQLRPIQLCFCSSAGPGLISTAASVLGAIAAQAASGTASHRGPFSLGFVVETATPILTKHLTLWRLRRLRIKSRSPGRCPGPRALRGTVGASFATPPPASPWRLPTDQWRARRPLWTAPAAFRGTEGHRSALPLWTPPALGEGRWARLPRTPSKPLRGI